MPMGLDIQRTLFLIPCIQTFTSFIVLRLRYFFSLRDGFLCFHFKIHSDLRELHYSKQIWRMLFEVVSLFLSFSMPSASPDARLLFDLIIKLLLCEVPLNIRQRCQFTHPQVGSNSHKLSQTITNPAPTSPPSKNARPQPKPSSCPKAQPM